MEGIKMLNEFAHNVLKNHKINEEDVESVDNSLVVTFKDGSKQQIVECWSRCMGYYRPMSEYNVGKRQEHEDRQYFQQPASAGECSCK